MPSSSFSTSSSEEADITSRLTGPVHLIAASSGAHSGISRYCHELHKGLRGRVLVRLCSFRPPPLAGRFTFLEHLPLGVQPDERKGIYHFTRIMGCSLMLWRPVRPAVATVHDLGPLLWPPEYEVGNILSRFLFRLSLVGLKRMDRIVAVSHASAQSLINLLGISNERIVVVHEGVDYNLFQPVPEAKAALEEKYGIWNEAGVLNLLYVGSEAPRKNLGTLLGALAMLKAAGITARLIKVGNAGHPRHRAAFLGQITRLGLDGNVAVVGEVPDADLPVFYGAADVLVLPSYVEGFGLPALEAMACGTPVVCSDAGALPEVVGDAALLLQPDDVQGLADAIAAVLEDASLRERLVEAGLERSQRFTWAKTAERTRIVYEEVMGHSELGAHK